jgi:hypothetical protein
MTASPTPGNNASPADGGQRLTSTYSGQAAIQLYRDDTGRLVLIDANGESHIGVQPLRTFPISDDNGWIALINARGKEVALIEDLGGLPPDMRALVEEGLADREFLPRILRVVHVAMNKEPYHWDVITDRGPVTFLLRDADDIRRLGPTRAILVDMHGVRYYIPDSRQLDAKSRRILSQYL